MSTLAYSHKEHSIHENGTITCDIIFLKADSISSLVECTSTLEKFVILYCHLWYKFIESEEALLYHDYYVLIDIKSV